MDRYGILHLAGVPAGQGNCHRHSSLAETLKNQAITLPQAGFAQSQAPQAIISVGIRSGQVNH